MYCVSWRAPTPDTHRARGTVVQDANNFPELRFMTTKKTTADAPQRELQGIELPWSVSNNVSVSDDGKYAKATAGPGRLGDDNWLYMSAVCYLYGRNLHQALGVPIGLMNSNWGGTSITKWGEGDPLFNAMIAPLTNVTIKGAIWYVRRYRMNPPQHQLARCFSARARSDRVAHLQGSGPGDGPTLSLCRNLDGTGTRARPTAARKRLA